jgi:GNAT superfamily N-acetyltransferase
MWRPGAWRVTPAMLADLVRQGQLAVARDDDRVAGCVRVASIDAGTAELGLLSVADAARGTGVGRARMRFAERCALDRGHATMRLQLLVPREGVHAFKQRLDAWYRRAGYRVVAAEDFAAGYPESAAWLAAPCELVTYERPLSAAG